jgi:hypothetical protein
MYIHQPGLAQPQVQAQSTQPAAAAAKPADIVRICLIDPAGLLKSQARLREDFRSKLEEKFNKLDTNWLKQQTLAFRVVYIAGDLSDDAKGRLGELDFPVYLLGRQHGSKSVRELMTKHRIPKEIDGQDLYELAKDCWDSRDTRGCGIPSGTGSRKIGFMRVDKVIAEAPAAIWQALVNSTAHEVGHMGNRRQHSKKGLMKYPVPQDRSIDFDTADKYHFLSDLVRLRKLREQRKPRLLRWTFR